MEPPPGIVYLVQRLPRILIPPTLVYFYTLLSSAYLNLPITGWILAAALLLSLPTALSITVLWSDFLIYLDARAHGAALPPSLPDPSPGGLLSLLRAMRESKKRNRVEALAELHLQLGGYTFSNGVLFENRIVTSEPEHIKMILATQFDNFEKGPEIRHLFSPLLGTGVFASDGSLWKFHRSMSRPFFSKDRISHFDNFDRHAEDAINRLKSRLQEGYPIDFQDLASRFTLDSATEFLFGNNVDSLSAGLPYPHYSPLCESTSTSSTHPATQFAQAFSEAQSIIAKRTRFGYHWPLMEFWHDKIKKPMKIVHSFINPIVSEAIARKKAKGIKADVDKINDDENLLGHLVNSTEDPIILRDAIMSLLVAGRDTTASTLTFTVYMLAEYPKVLTKLRQEILEKIGPSRRPDYDDIKNMKYLRAVINETLRLYPVVPFNIRTSIKPTIWPNDCNKKPFYIPANTRTPYSVMTMHRRKDLWGESALEFDPDRFIDERVQTYLTPNPFIFLPFNAGPRICLGQQFAYNEVSFFLVRLLQAFSAISLATDAQPLESRAPECWASGEGRKGREKIRPKTHLTMYVQDGLWVTMQEVSHLTDA